MSDNSRLRGFAPRPSRAKLIPAWVLDDAPPAVVEANQAAAEAIDADDRARHAAVEAERVAKEASEGDDRAALEAHRAGRKPPAPTQPKKQADAEAANRTADLARREANTALDALLRERRANHDALVALAAPAVRERVTAVRSALQELELLFDQLADRAGTLTNLHVDRPEFGRASLKPGGVDVAGAIDQLRVAVAAQEQAAIPLRARILDAVGDTPTAWNTVAEKIGVHRLDDDACTLRGFLVEDGLLAWVDQDGVPAGARQRGAVFNRRLVRSTPTETKVERARRERRQREASRAA